MPLDTPLSGFNPVFDAPCAEVLALGAHLNNTVTVMTGGRAYVSTPLGDLDTPDARDRFEATVDALCKETGAGPTVVAHDLHPDFYSTRFAETLAETLGLPRVPVQHHHAHMGALAVEHGLDGPFLGLAFDGFGLGPDKQSWGGELLLVHGADCRRLGSLRPLPQPGGDRAAQEPWRMGAAVLHELGRGAEVADRYAVPMLDQVIKTSPLTSSCGRLFDAACGLLGVPTVQTFEALVTAPSVHRTGWVIEDGRLDLLPLMDRLTDMTPEAGANLFHGTLAAAVLDWVQRASDETGVKTVALGGGCFFNRALCRLLDDGLAARGLRACFAEKVSPGDAAISLGQAWVATQAGEN